MKLAMFATEALWHIIPAEKGMFCSQDILENSEQTEDIRKNKRELIVNFTHLPVCQQFPLINDNQKQPEN